MRIRYFLILVIVLVTVSRVMIAQEHENIEQIGRIYEHWSEAEDVAVVEDLAYLATGTSGMLIVDLSDLENPSLIGSWVLDGIAAQHLEVRVDYAYVLTSNGLYVISIDNPEDPQLVEIYERARGASKIFFF